MALTCTFGTTIIGCAGTAPMAVVPEVVRDERVPEQIITPREGMSGSARELYARGDRALLAGQFEEAKDAFETLLAAWRGSCATSVTSVERTQSCIDRDELEPSTTYDLALAYEGLGRRSSARDMYLDVERRFADKPVARLARARLFSVHAYLEEWDKLGTTAERSLAQPALEPSDRMAALAARALARIERGDEANAARDVQDGLDLMESLAIGAGGRLPTSAAMLRFAQGEVRRMRSEKVSFDSAATSSATTASSTNGGASAGGRTGAGELAAFMPKMEMRCQGLMDAQGSYGDAMRAQDPFFIAFGAFRVGEMYKALHRDLMAIPPTTQAKTNGQQQLFFAMMHVRYRVLLEKANDMMTRTLAMAPRSEPVASGGPVRDPDFSVWVKRAAVAKQDIERAIEEERRLIAGLPYDEPTVRRALDILREKAEKAAAAKASARSP